jgi:hypothetical protein
MDFRATIDELADLWVRANQRTDPSVSLRTLSRKVVSNVRLFSRPRMSLAAFESIRDYLAEPRNWPAALIPDEAATILEKLGREVPAEARFVRASAA